MWPFNQHDSRKTQKTQSWIDHCQLVRRACRSNVQLELEVLEDRVLMSAGDIFFTTQTLISANKTDTKLYMGTPSGNTLLKDFGSDTVDYLTVVGSKVYFFVLPSSGTNQLWVSDGTSAGTREVYDSTTGTIGNLTAVGNKVAFTLFSTTSSGTDTQLWASDGTSAGTSLVRDLQTAGINAKLSVGDQLYLATTMGVGEALDAKLYVSDGTPLGTVTLADTGVGANVGIESLTTAGGKVAFVVINPSGDYQLWATSGTPGSTAMVFDSNGNFVSYPVDVGSSVYFVDEIKSANNTLDDQLWVSNLTFTGNTMLKDFGRGNPPPVNTILAAGNQVYIVADIPTSSGTGDMQLWAATPSAATQLMDYGNNSFSPIMTAVGNQLYFVFVTSSSQTTTYAQLYVTGGTQSSTVPIFDTGGGSITLLIGAGSQVFINTTTISIVGNNAIYSEQLYTSNGLAVGTHLLTDSGGYPAMPQAAASQLYFTTKSSTGGSVDYRLYTSDGTRAGTTYQDFGASEPTDLVAVIPLPSGGNGGGNSDNGGGGGSVSSGGSGQSVPPSLNVPPLLAFFDVLLGGAETVNADGTETITDYLFGFPLLVATFDNSGNLMSVDLFGFDVTFLFG